ncbi:hypothetical protein [Pelagibacterium sp.]|uniref:hypothetical protein n=1 Tax=Pelagibacterium sp. TaxID=1967288 RepID=UPI003A905635
MFHAWTKPTGLAICAILATASHALCQGIYYGQREWDGPNNGLMNISTFVFRDINASGSYDLGDRVFANIAVEMLAPSGVVAVARTNIGGYANFNASVALAGAEIPGEGAYSFRVVPPPGWAVTTGNGEQSVSISGLAGAPGDLVADSVPQPVGLAAIPEIRGRQDEGDTIIASNASGHTVQAQAAEDGVFRIPASPGPWTIGNRAIEVGHIPIVLPGDWSAEGRTQGSTKTLGFDDLFVGDEILKVPNGYGGLQWENWVAVHARFYEGEGYINTAVSDEYVAYTSSGHPTAVLSDVPFDFLGGYFGVAWSSAEGEILRIRAWRDGALIHSDRFALSAYGPVYFAADYKSITRLEFATEHYWQAVADDLRFVTTERAQ